MGTVVKINHGKYYTLFITMSNGEIMKKYIHMEK